MYLTASLIQAYVVHQRSRREQKYVYTAPKKIPHSYDQYIDYGIFSKVKKSYSTRDVNKVLIIIYYLYVYVIAVKGSCKHDAKEKKNHSGQLQDYSKRISNDMYCDILLSQSCKISLHAK